MRKLYVYAYSVVSKGKCIVRTTKCNNYSPASIRITRFHPSVLALGSKLFAANQDHPNVFIFGPCQIKG